MTYRIEERLQQLVSKSSIQLPRRPEFQDPMVASLESVQLSRVIDQELDRFYNPMHGGVISRVFQRFRA